MPKTILDQKLLKKVAKKLSRDVQKVRVNNSRKASKLAISPEAALILTAKELNIGVASFQRKLEPAKQTEIRDALPSIFKPRENKYSNDSSSSQKHRANPPNQKAMLRAAIEYLISDDELKDRCENLILAKSNFDIAINQATLILEDRIRKKAPPPKHLVGVDLVSYAINGDLSKTILQVSSKSSEQQGFADILRGFVLAFRNKTHHHIIDTFTREEALKVCGFIDILLGVIDNAKSIPHSHLSSPQQTHPPSEQTPF